MSNSPAIIKTHALLRRFGDLVAVRDLAISVSEGEVFGFLGHNGAGKTTTVRLLNGILAPTSGRIEVLGLDPLTDGPALRRQTGVLTESPSLDERLTSRETLTLFGKLYGVNERELDSRVADLLEAFDLGNRADELVGGFSKGMRQRLALSRTLIHRPKLLFLDEPTGGLDPVARRDVHNLIMELSRRHGRTVFLCTHDLAEAQKLCDRVGVMEEGQLVAVGTPDDLARDLQRGVRLMIEVDARPKLLDREPQRDVRDSDRAHWKLSWDAAHLNLQAWLPTRAHTPELIRALVDTGAHIYSVVPEDPTLEDVYFALHDDSHHARPQEPAR